jgi:hypothetical protein
VPIVTQEAAGNAKNFARGDGSHLHAKPFEALRLRAQKSEAEMTLRGRYALHSLAPKLRHRAV